MTRTPTLREIHKKLKSDRDALLEALKGVLPVFWNPGTAKYAVVYKDRIEAADKAIAQAEHETHLN